MVYFTSIEPTQHYLDYHAKNVPWDKVVEIILTTKNPRKKGNKFEIKKEYLVKLNKVINDQTISRLKKGIKLAEGTAKADDVNKKNNFQVLQRTNNYC